MNRDSAQALQDALDGRHPIGRLNNHELRLVRLGRDCRRIQVAGPSPATLYRIEARFDRFVLQTKHEGIAAWARGWFGRGSAPRPLLHRLAAASLFVSAIGFGGSATAGVGPVEFAKGIARLGGNIIVNLAPHELSTADGPTPGDDPESESLGPISTPSPPGDNSGAGRPVAAWAEGSQAPTEGAPSQTPTAAVADQEGAPPTSSHAPDATAVTAPTVTVTPRPGTASTANPLSPEGLTPAPEFDDEAGSPGVVAPVATSTPTPPGSPLPTATPTPTAGQAGWQAVTYPAGTAGSVVLRYSSTSLELVEAVAASGWTSHVEDIQPLYFKISFEREGDEVEFEAALIDGELVTSLDGSGQETDPEPGQEDDGGENE